MNAEIIDLKTKCALCKLSFVEIVLSFTRLAWNWANRKLDKFMKSWKVGGADCT